MRVVSLVPSLTELLYHLQVEVVGITKFCVHPTIWYRTLPRVGGTKNPDIEYIKALNPDLVIANREENRREDVEALQNFTRVLVTHISTIEDAILEIRKIGEVCEAKNRAEDLIHNINLLWQPLKNIIENQRAVYLIWRNPYMAAGTDTYIHHVLCHLGFKNAVTKSRYPTLNRDDISCLRPDVIFLSSEPYPFKDRHVDELTEISSGSRVVLVDGQAFSWYGYRMVPAAEYLYNLAIKLKSFK